MPLYLNYSVGNAIAFNGAAFSCISFIVFLASTQPFYLAEVLGFKHKDNIGAAIGTLGVIDELAAIVFAPLIGALCDKITAGGKISGSRATIVMGFTIIGVSFLCYGKLASHFYPDLAIFRTLFALGVTSTMSMVTVMFTEISNSDLDILSSLSGIKRSFTRQEDDPESIQRLLSNDSTEDLDLNPTPPTRKTGRYAAMMGISTGLGAIFAVSFFLTLPARLQTHFPELSNKDALKLAYLSIGVLSIITGAILYFFIYAKDNNAALAYQQTHISTTGTPTTGYFKLLKHGLMISKRNTRVQLSYVGAFVARLTAVSTGIFVPLLVYNFFYKSGICGGEEATGPGKIPSKQDCHEGYIFAAILTGVGQTIALVTAPIWGTLIDYKRLGNTRCLFLASLCGVLGCFGLCFHGIGENSDAYDPRNITSFIMVGLLGISHIGTVMSSMSLLSSVVSETKDLISIGSISGMYSLSGGLGILLITLVGGKWSDSWIHAPFFILGTFHIILLSLSIRLW